MNAKRIAGLALILVLMVLSGAWGMKPRRDDPKAFPPLGVGAAPTGETSARLRGAVAKSKHPKAAAKSPAGAAVMVGEASSVAPGEAEKALQDVGGRITSSIAAANDRIARLGSDITRLGSLIKSLQEQKTGLDARVSDATKAHGTEIPAAVAAITAEHEKLKQEHATLSSDVEKLTAEEGALTGQREDLAGKLAAADAELARLKAAAGALPGQHRKEQEDLKSKHAGQMTQTAAAHKEKADPLGEKINAAEAARAQLKTELKAVQDELAKVEAELANVSKSSEEKGVEVGTVQAQHQSTIAKHDEASVSVEALDTAVKALAGQILALQENLRSVEAEHLAFDRKYATGLNGLSVPNAQELIQAATATALAAAGISEAEFNAALSQKR